MESSIMNERGSAVRLRSIGLHVPRYRLEGRDVAEFWERKASNASRAVANWDEDVVTMGVAAAERCLANVARDVVGTVIVASTTHTYGEKQSAAMVAEALDLPETVETLDVAGSLRSGTQILRLAADRVASGGHPVLLVAADVRAAVPGSPEELSWGDGAAAVLVATDGPLEVRFVVSRYDTGLSTWRLAGEQHPRSGDARFVAGRAERAVQLGLEEAVRAGAASGGPPTRAAVASSVPTLRAAIRAGFADGAVHGPDIQQEIGYTGAASPFFSLAAALEEAAVGESVAWASLGDGIDAAYVVVHDSAGSKGVVRRATAQSQRIPYRRYLKLTEVVGDQPPVPFSSEIAQWRDARRTARLLARRCGACDHVTYPPQPVCPACHDRGHAIDAALPRVGRLVTFTVEHLFPNPEGYLAMGVLELEGGIRFYCSIVDVELSELAVGTPLRLVYRRMHQGGGFVNYYWKATRAEEGGS